MGIWSKTHSETIRQERSKGTPEKQVLRKAERAADRAARAERQKGGKK